MSLSPFEVSYEELLERLDLFVQSVFDNLTSDFLTMPRGPLFIEYATFEQGYETLKKHTSGFREMDLNRVLEAVAVHGISFVVLRTMLGFTPPEWARVSKIECGVNINQGFARSVEGDIRKAPLEPLRVSNKARTRFEAMVTTACVLLRNGAPEATADKIHRLDKMDTLHGVNSLSVAASLGVPYAMLLYERFLGRPFAGHRDSISELIGDAMEGPIEKILTDADISYRKTKRAEKIPGFDQAPDFIIPSEFNPQVVIEAKIAEDDGTARDKVTRIQHLASISGSREREGKKPFEVVACISGRGFGVRREDMKKLLIATKGKVFTLKTLPALVINTRLNDFATK